MGKLKLDTDYYVMTDENQGLPILTVVQLHGDDDADDDMVYVVWKCHVEDEWLWSGYVFRSELITGEKIIKLYNDHMMLVEACERHG